MTRTTHRRRFALVASIAVGLLLAGCSGGGSSSTSAAPAAPSGSVQASVADTGQAELDAALKQAQRQVDALEVRIKAEPSLDKRLSLIVTAYCKLSVDPVMVDTEELYLLADLFDKYWQAGGRWSSPLDAAAVQQGGCPSTYSTVPPSRG